MEKLFRMREPRRVMFGGGANALDEAYWQEPMEIGELIMFGGS
jgi:hypothetical protein